MYELSTKLKESSKKDLFTDAELVQLIQGSTHRRYGLVKRALKKRELIQIRRGLYCLGSSQQRHSVDLFDMAQHIYGPSFISFESALSYHNWIPEAVHSITNACFKRSRDFHTPFGEFAYVHVPTKTGLTSVERIETESAVFLMATPWRALIDYVHAYKKNWHGAAPLKEILRIEEDSLQDPPQFELDQLENAYKSHRVTAFIQGLKRDLQP